MIRNLLLGIGLTMSVAMMAQSGEPEIISRFRALQMSANGQWMIGRSTTWLDEETGYYSPESSICNIETGEIYGLNDLFTLTPVSRTISSTGVAIASTYAPETNYYEIPYLIVPGEEPVALQRFNTEGPYKGLECYAVAIADDASAFLAYYEAYPKQYPFICPINPDYTVGEPEYFPLPQKDIFGKEPYSVQLTWMSADCNTVAGLLIASDPNYAYPIVYTKTGGTWSYSCPTEKLFDANDPESFPTFYYSAAGSQIALSPDGTKLACTREIPSENSNFPIYNIWLIDLTSGELTPVTSENPDLIATGVLDDGTIVATFFATITVGYIKTPEMSDFVDFAQYLASISPEAGTWMEENIMVKVQDVTPSGEIVDLLMPDTGQVFVSDDLSVIGAGKIINTEFDESYNPVYYSYIFNDLPGSAGVEEIKGIADDGVLRVYNLTGVNILNTRDASRLNELAKGVYIVNGKKIAIK